MASLKCNIQNDIMLLSSSMDFLSDFSRSHRMQASLNSFFGDSPRFFTLHALKWHTEFGHLNRGDMLTSEQHRCSNEKKKF
ncbi:hypothetical protein DVN72_17020 [Shigella flexneri]|nr:hypothetical protein [Shigella flexneri]